jgi:hypothetical protein
VTVPVVQAVLDAAIAWTDANGCQRRHATSGPTWEMARECSAALHR